MWFQIDHFEINIGIFATLNLLFDDLNYPIVELHLEFMLEWVLQNDLIWLENARQFARTKITKIFGCFSFIQSKKN
jgi:hypothetical protein